LALTCLSPQLFCFSNPPNFAHLFAQSVTKIVLFKYHL
jgi:hypothetical protein